MQDYFFADNKTFYFVFQIKTNIFAFVIGLERHIEILLLNNDCVIIPGLGGFIASHIPARYDDDDRIFLPPLRTLGFNPKLNINDSLLVQSYSEYYDISYPEALTRIENESNELKQHIMNNGSYELNDIGTLYLNEEGNMEFKPCEAGILTPELYSLSSFGMEKKSVSVSIDKKNSHVLKDRTNSLKEERKLKNSGQEASEEGENKLKDKTISIKLSLLRNVAAVIIAVVMFFAISSPVGNNGNAIKMSSIDNGVISNLIDNSCKSVTNKKEINLASSKKKESTIPTNAKKVNLEKAEQKRSALDDYYCIVLASQVSKSNAETFVNTLSDKGFKEATVLNKAKKSIKVIYGKYKSENEAYNKLRKMRASEYFKEAWVYHVKD